MKRCKRGVLNHEEDRIGQLPEDLILHILSQLETKDAISTSVLSKKWQSLWKMIPNLKFDTCRTLSKNVCRSLLSYKAPVLESLHLKTCPDKCDAMDTGILIGIALAHNVRELILDVKKKKVLMRFPRSLYISETLETLKLRFNVLMDVPPLVCLKSLRTLHLHHVDYKNNESVVRLLSGCPKLENLVVRRSPTKKVTTFTIAVPSLQRLSIYNYSVGGHHQAYVINAPCLKYLKIQGIGGIGSGRIENVSKLVEANIINVYAISTDDILKPLTSVKRLSLDLWPLQIKFPIGSIFKTLVYLEISTIQEAWWNLLTLMLVSSPILKVLKLIDKGCWRKDLVDYGRWNQPKNVPECLLFHLETFMWIGYEWQQVDEKEVAKYILRNTDRLKRATFSLKLIDSHEEAEMIKELESVARASNSCQLVFD